MKIILIDIPSVPFVQPKEFQKLNKLKCELEDIWAEKKGVSVEKYSKRSYSIGLLNLSYYLKQKIKDIKISYSHYKNFSKLKNIVLNSDYIGISSMSPFISIVNKLTIDIKKYSPNVKIVVGGPGPTHEPEKYLNLACVDYVILGEGEISFYKLIKGENIKQIKGIGFKVKDQYVINRDIEYLKNFTIPGTDYSILEDNLNNYSLNITSMRGCLYKCDFCAKFQGNIRFRKIDDVIFELRYLDQVLRKNTLIHFADNVINVNEKRFHKLMDKIIKSNFRNINFSCDIRADHVTKEIIKKLNCANFKRINLGVEDCNNDVLRGINKQLNYKQIKKAIDIIKKYSDSLISLYWMIGLPGTNKKTITQNLKEINELIKNKNADFVLPSLLKPYPGSNIASNPLSYYIKIVNSWDRWLNNYYLPLWESSDFKVNDLSKLNKLYLRTIVSAYKKRYNRRYNKKISFYNVIGL